MSFHIIILNFRQLVRILVEGYGQFSRRNNIAKKNIGNSRATVLPRIPGLQNGVAGFGFRHQTNGRAREVDQHHLFTSVVKGCNQSALNTRQFNVGAVAARKARDVHRHFLAFQTWRYSACKHHNINVFQKIHNRIHIQCGQETAFHLLVAAQVPLDIAHANGQLFGHLLQLFVGHINVRCRETRVGCGHIFSIDNAAGA